MSSSLFMSATKPATWPSAASSVGSSASIFAWLVEENATFAPSARKPLTMAVPMPPVPPVTNTTLSFSLRSIDYPPYFSGAAGIVLSVARALSLECVSKSREMQFRVDLTAFQGAFPQAYWLQVKEKQHRNAVKYAENALQGF